MAGKNRAARIAGTGKGCWRRIGDRPGARKITV
jgi:hypothetical protein